MSPAPSPRSRGRRVRSFAATSTCRPTIRCTAELRKAGLVDAWQSMNPGMPHPPTFRLHEPKDGVAPYCCDFVFVTPDLVPRLRSIRIDADNRASDHQPVIVELR
jgi:Exonuclease III